MDVLDPNGKVGMQSIIYTSVPLAFLTSVPVASMDAQASTSLGPLPHLPSFSLQLAHSLLTPLGSHGTEVPKKMALRLRGYIFIFKAKFKSILLLSLKGFPSSPA